MPSNSSKTDVPESSKADAVGSHNSRPIRPGLRTQGAFRERGSVQPDLPPRGRIAGFPQQVSRKHCIFATRIPEVDGVSGAIDSLVKNFIGFFVPFMGIWRN